MLLKNDRSLRKSIDEADQLLPKLINNEGAGTEEADFLKTVDKTIVCVDDNFVNLSSFKMQLEMMGFQGEIQCLQGSQATLDFIYDFLY